MTDVATSGPGWLETRREHCAQSQREERPGRRETEAKAGQIRLGKGWAVCWGSPTAGGTHLGTEEEAEEEAVCFFLFGAQRREK